MRVDVVTDERRLDELGDDWDRLLRATPEWSGFQSLAWIGACRRALPGDASLFVLRFRVDAETVALLPTELAAHGELRFIGGPVTNYGGLLYRREHLDHVVHALGQFLGDEPRVSLADFAGLRARSPATAALRELVVPGWAAPRAVRLADCPLVDLTPGWQDVYGRRRSGYRSGVSRKWSALQRLGSVEFVEVTRASEVRSLLPALFELFRARWRGRHESGGFADRYRRFHEVAMPALAAAGHLRLSLLRLAGEVVAFAYGVHGARGTSSYVLGHANALAHHSPGQLLLVRSLEAACTRGDAEYDLSIGDEGYKRIWATGSDPLTRIVLARQEPAARVRAGWRRLQTASWVGARSVLWLRDVRREGLRALLGQRAAGEPLADAPGLPAGPKGLWLVYRLAASAADASVTARTWDYAEMRQHLSPQLLHHAAERSFRGDRLLALSRSGSLLGVVWQAADRRRDLVTGGNATGHALPVYYHPVCATGVDPGVLVEALRAMVEGKRLLLVSAGAPPGTDVKPHASFLADHGFRPALRVRPLLRLALTRLARTNGHSA